MRIGRNEIPTSWYVNGAAGSLALFLVGFIVHDYLVKHEVPTCSDRFTQGTIFSLQNRNGELISAAELQGRLAGSDVGVIENLQVVRAPDAASESVMRVRLATVEDGSQGDGPRISGIGFTWFPRRMPITASTCLTYDFKVPADFPFSPGGSLPGLLGGNDSSTDDSAQANFFTRPRWTGEGKLEIRVSAEDKQYNAAFAVDSNWLKITPGNWLRLEQEVVLNTPGQPDGILRVWVDGSLKLEKGGITYRMDQESRVQGVVASLSYLGKTEPPKTASGQPALIEVSPFELRWP